MGQTYVDIDQSAQSVTTVLGHLDDRTDTLMSCFSGTGAPGTPVEGMLWLDTSATPHILKQYSDRDGGGAGWFEIASTEELGSDLEFSFQQALEMRVENLAADEAVAAGKDGHVFFHTGVGEIKFVDQSTDNAVKTVCSVIAGTTVDKLHLSLNDAMKDATNPPTVKAKGTTPQWRGLEFDAANELMSFSFIIPQNYSADGDCFIKLACVLDQAETAADDIDWSADVSVAGNTDSVTGTSTAAAASTTDIGANNADGDLHVCSITLDYDDGDNPLAAGKYCTVEIHRTDLAEVGGVIVVQAHFEYPVDGGVQ